MKNKTFTFKFFAIVIALLFVFQSMQETNSHTYSIGLSTFHETGYCPEGITCCFGSSFSHMIYECGKTFHL
ncbi:hypothetical protein [Psychroserpens sp.]